MAVSPYVSRAELWLANSSFRPTFHLPNDFHPSVFLKWFPGHMAKALRMMQLRLQKCDCVIEVHDARINPKLKEKLQGRPHVLVLNKADLLGNMKKKQDILRCLEDDGIRAMFTDSKAQCHHSIRKIIPMALEAIKDAEYEGTYIRPEPDKPYNILICGLPNTGKSSLVNALRRKYMKKGKATRVGAVPGITTSIENRIKVCDEPVAYMYDTPGIMAPYIPTAEVGMKLALTGCFKDHVVGEDLIADYLLFTLNKQKCFKYVDMIGLTDPSDSIDFVMRQLAVKLQGPRSGRTPDYLKAHVHFISRFRRGLLSSTLLDEIPER